MDYRSTVVLEDNTTGVIWEKVEEGDLCAIDVCDRNGLFLVVEGIVKDVLEVEILG